MSKEYSIPSGETGGYPCTIIDVILSQEDARGGPLLVVTPRALFFKLQVYEAFGTVAATLEDYNFSKKPFMRYSHSCDIEKKKIIKSCELNFVSFLAF